MHWRELLEASRPLLEQQGRLYRKTKNVLARKALAGEQVFTATADGKETKNTAQEGDYIVRNQTEAQEEYIVPGGKFAEKYEWIAEGEHDFDEFRSKGRIIALELTEKNLQELGLSEICYFVAPWGEEMVAKIGDFLACPLDYSELYRIARKEFFETYRPYS